MAFLICDDERYALEIGETVLGGGGEAALPCPALAAIRHSAIVTVTPDNVATIRAPGGSDVTLDGNPVGPDPRPLRHGARIVIAGQQLLFGDLRRTGSTSYVAGISDDQLAALGALPGEPTADTGGQLIALRGGHVYEIPPEGLQLGRDPACDVVIESRDVSRRHAIISPGLFGYLLTDTSANGVLVNGARVDGVRVLGRGDKIRIGPDEFRFEADAATYEPDPAVLKGDAPGTTIPMSARQQQEASDSGRAASSSRPVEHPASSRSLLATLEVLNEGVHKGSRFRIERPVTHLGRGNHNDIVLPDGSVSASHATLQLRKSGWYVVDAGSTNGTYLDGDRVQGERQLRGPCELRFGNIKTVFRPIGGSAAGQSDSTRSIVGITDDRLNEK